MVAVWKLTTNSSIENKAAQKIKQSPHTIFCGLIRLHEAAVHVVQVHMVLRRVHPAARMKQKVPSEKVMFRTTLLSDEKIMKKWCQLLLAIV